MRDDQQRGIYLRGKPVPGMLLRALASTALARVEGGNSEWSELWTDGGSLAEATAVLDSIRLHL
jgi:hypothetical protein